MATDHPSPERPTAGDGEFAARPYPNQYVGRWQLSNGQIVTIRPIRPDDEPRMIRFHETLSPETVYRRYFALSKLGQRTNHERLIHVCRIDDDSVMVLVAERSKIGSTDSEIIGVGRLMKHADGLCAEWAVVVSDAYQHQGLGTELVRRLIQFARDEKLKVVVADILFDNLAMQRVCEKLGMKLYREAEQDTVRARLAL